MRALFKHLRPYWDAFFVRYLSRVIVGILLGTLVINSYPAIAAHCASKGASIYLESIYAKETENQRTD